MSVDLKEYFEAEKLLSRHPNWIPAERDALRLASPIEIDGVTVAGLEFCAYAMTEFPDEAVCVQLQYKPPKGRGYPFCRLEWRPIREHSNNGKGPDEFKFIKFRSTHIHPFDLNYDVATGKMSGNNLPIAVPIKKEPQTMQDFLALAAKEFRINNIDWVPLPPWQPRFR